MSQGLTKSAMLSLARHRIMVFQRDLVRAAEHFLRVARYVFPSPIGDPCELPRSPFVARQRSAEGIPDYSQITDNTQRRCAVHTKSGKEINLNGLVGSVPSSIPQTSC